VSRLVLAALLALLAFPSGASGAILGEQRLLLMLTTWGPEPYAPADVRVELDEAGAYLATASFGKTSLVSEVTPWLHALPAEPACDTFSIAQAAQAAATAAGYQLGRYTTLGIAMPQVDACFWGGAYFPPGIWLNGRNDRQVIVHELGHTYGLPEEGFAWVCSGSCSAAPYRNPFSVMGHGWSDFSAWEKHVFGWLDRIAAPAPRLTLGAIDRPSADPQALRVVVAGDQYWFEYRPPAPRWAYDAGDAVAGVAVYAGWNGLSEAGRFSGRNLLLYDPVGRGRPAVRAGEVFTVRGAFSVRVVSAGPDSAELAFRWTDRTRPARPDRLAWNGRVLSWSRGVERGSGLAAHDVLVNGRRVARVQGVRRTYRLPLRAGPRKRIAVVAVDRAGNRSRAARLAAEGATVRAGRRP
jgi:hypothetical protein